jgi:hypothetical protein
MILILMTELKDNIPDETFDVLRFPNAVEKHLKLLYVFNPCSLILIYITFL